MSNHGSALEIECGYVYENEAGEQRLVSSVSPNFACDLGRLSEGGDCVVIWRTARSYLPAGARAQGSAALRSFQRWAVRGRKATAEDWRAFAHAMDTRKRMAHIRRSRKLPLATRGHSCSPGISYSS